MTTATLPPSVAAAYGQTIDDIVASQGWTDATILDLLWEYVHNQGATEAVREHFLQAAEEVEVIDEPA